MAGGRPSKFTKKIADEICLRIADGESLSSICRDKHMPARSTVFLWVADREAFSDKYEKARAFQADAWADEVVDIADDVDSDWIDTPDGPKVNSDHIQRARLRIDTRKWIAGKQRPRRYGPKIEVEQTNFNVTISGDDAEL